MIFRRLLATTLRVALAAVDDAPPPCAPAPLSDWHGESVFAVSPEHDSRRRDFALSVMDPECISYVAVIARYKGGEIDMDLRIAIDDELWPAFQDTLATVVLEGARVYE